MFHERKNIELIFPFNALNLVQFKVNAIGVTPKYNMVETAILNFNS